MSTFVSYVMILPRSPPYLGYLEADAEITSVNLVNLQLFIYTQQLSPSQFASEPAEGEPGFDLNGDGDYVDTGEQLPRPASKQPRKGLVNGGLFTSYTLRNQTLQRIRDFSLAFGGRFVGAVTGPGKAVDANGQPVGQELPPSYTTLSSGGQRLDRQTASLNLALDPKRVFLLFGAQIEISGVQTPANLALISLPPQDSSSGGKVVVVDVTNPQNPRQVGEVSIPQVHGIPQSIRKREDGVLMLATSEDILLLDPTKLGTSPPAGSNRPHPALVGLVSGEGGGMRSFVGSVEGFYATANGGRNRLAGAPGKVNLTIHRPGLMRGPGRAIREVDETNPLNLIISVNDDNDDAILPADDLPAKRKLRDHFDNQDLVAGLNDGDIVKVAIQRLPPGADGAVKGRLSLKAQSGSVQAVRFFNKLGNALVPTSQTAGLLTFETDFEAGTGPFLGLASNDEEIFLEGLAPHSDVRITLNYDDSNGLAVGEDEVHLAVVKLTISEIWSDQLPSSTVNRLPGSSGSEQYPFLLVGNRSDDKTYVKAQIALLPDTPELKQRIRLRLGQICEKNRLCLVGESSLNGNIISIKAQRDTSLPVLSPYGLDYFVVGGVDYDFNNELIPEEVSTVFGKAYLANSELIFSALDNPQRVAEEHLKVVHRALYETKRLQYLTVANSVIAVSTFSFPSFGARNLRAFCTGNPLALPASLGDLSGVPATVGPDEVLIPNQKTEHNVGVPWDSSGTGRVPHYIIDDSTYLPDRIMSAIIFREKIKDLLRGKAGEIRNHFANNPNRNTDILSWHFRDGINFSSIADFCGDFIAFSNVTQFAEKIIQLLQDCPDYDLYVGIGGAVIDLDVTVDALVSPFPYTPASSVHAISVTIKGKLEDLYDWNYVKAWPDEDLAIIQAGHPTLGDGGKIFSYEIRLDEDITDLGFSFP